MAVAGEPFLVAECRGKRLPEGDTDILNRVMGIDMQITLGLDFEVELAVTCNSSMWSRKGTPLAKRHCPLPSSMRRTRTWVSRVFLLISACRMGTP